MKLRLIYGRSGSGKTFYCLHDIKSRVENGADRPLILLVPEQFTFQAERELSAVLQAGGILQVDVLSFQRLAYRVFSEAGGLAYPHIHPAGKCMILYNVLNRLKRKLKVFAKAADREGFVQKIADLITEFKRHTVSPESLQNAIDALDAGNPLKDKMTELGLIYAGFEDALAGRYRDADDDLTVAAAKLEGNAMYDGAEIWIDGFAGFTPQEYAVIARLLAKGHRMTLSLCTDVLQAADGPDETDIFAQAKSVYWRLTRIVSETGAGMEAAVALNGKYLPRFARRPELAHLERNLYAYPFRIYAERPDAVELFSSVTMRGEIENTAAKIIALCRDQGLRYRDIALIVRNLSAYERLLDAVFTEYGIPFFLDRKVEITNHPLVRLIVSMLDIFNHDWSYEAVFSYLKTGLTGIEHGKIDRLENYVLACGIRGQSRWLSPADWTMTPGLIPDERENAHDHEILAEINALRRTVVKPLAEFLAQAKGRRPVAEICAALYDFLHNLGIPARLEAYIHKFRQRGQLDLANEYAQVWNSVMAVLDQIVEAMGHETMGVERFAQTLNIGLAEYQIGLVPASLDQVLIGSAERSKSREIKALFVLGVNDGVFPAGAPEEGVLSDPERSVLKAAGVELAKDTRTQAFEEHFLVYRALTLSGDYLRLSWPIADAEGRSLRPSMIIARLRKLFPLLHETSDIASDCDADIACLGGAAPAFKKMVLALRRQLDGGLGPDEAQMWRGVYRWFAAQDDWQQSCRQIGRAFGYRNQAQPVSPGNIAKLYGNPAYASVSRLERFNSCPFAFYIQYALGAKERKIYKLNPPDIGTFLHSVIEEFSRLMSEQDFSWRDMEREWCREKVSAIIDDMLARMKGSGLAGSKRYTALTVRLKRVVTRAVWLIAEHIKRSGFEPVGYEVGFGDNEKFPPITIELDSGHTINLVGRIDRVDALTTPDGTYLRIIDYKSGQKDLKLSDVYYGLQLQLITYLDALWENESAGADPAKPVLPGGVLYFRIDDPMIRESGKMTEQELETAIMKQLKMKGLLLADVKLIRAMDRTMDGSSLIIPASLNKGDTISRYSRVATLDQFQALRRHVRKVLTELCQEMMKGMVAIQPYRKKTATSCQYCGYTAVCQFDPALSENNYRLLADKKDTDVWDELRGRDT